jgi:hypothetical protein
MGIIVTRPTKNVGIITDMTLLQKLIAIANELNDLTTESIEGLTEMEASTRNKQVKELHEKLTELKLRTDESTLMLTLHGLNASKWNLAVIKHTSTVEGKVVKDFLGMVKDTVPEMLDAVAWKKDSAAPVPDLKGKDLTDFLDSLTDTQAMDLVEAAQEINSPVTSVPKAVMDLI